MSVFCYFGRHKPSLQSVARRKEGGYTALCDSCGMRIERSDKESWRAADPVGGRRSQRVG